MLLQKLKNGILRGDLWLQLTVQIVTPDGLVYDHHASFVSVRTLDGEMGILPRHENMIAVLAVDEVKVKRSR